VPGAVTRTRHAAACTMGSRSMRQVADQAPAR
jgi:hypothetical protein